MAFTSNTFQLYETEFYTGYTEVLEQMALDMAATRGGIVLEARNLQGNLEKAAFYELIGGGAQISERDPTDTSAASWNDLTQGETIGVRVYRSSKERKALSAFREINQDPAIMSFVVGTQQAKAISLEMLNTGLAALTGALEAVDGGSVFYDATAEADAEDQVISPKGLVKMLDKMGDASSRIVAFVAPSRLAHSLLADQVVSSVSTIAGPAIYQGTFGSLSIPVLVTDSPALIDSVNDEYLIIGLTAGALRLTEAQERDVLTRQDDSAANIMIQMTTEFSFSVAVAGCAWDGGTYPSKGDLADDTNWNYSFTDKRSGPGVLAKFKASI